MGENVIENFVVFFDKRCWLKGKKSTFHFMNFVVGPEKGRLMTRVDGVSPSPPFFSAKNVSPLFWLSRLTVLTSFFYIFTQTALLSKKYLQFGGLSFCEKISHGNASRHISAPQCPRSSFCRSGSWSGLQNWPLQRGTWASASDRSKPCCTIRGSRDWQARIGFPTARWCWRWLTPANFSRRPEPPPSCKGPGWLVKFWRTQKSQTGLRNPRRNEATHWNLPTKLSQQSSLLDKKVRPSASLTS